MKRRARALALAMTACPAAAFASNFGEVKGLFELAGFVVLAPAHLWIVAAFIVGLAVGNSRTAVVWLWVLGLFSVPSLAVSVWVLYIHAQVPIWRSRLFNRGPCWPYWDCCSQAPGLSRCSFAPSVPVPSTRRRPDGP
jgi:hypothetical protein